MANVNKVLLIGHLGNDPDYKMLESGSSVCSFSIATSEKYVDKNGDKVEKTEWHNVVAWGKLANLCNQYIKKGSQVYVEGKLQTRKWTDKDGNTRYTTEVIANTVNFLDSAPSNGSSNTDSSSNDDIPF